MIFYSLHDTHVLTLFDQALRHVEETGHGSVRPQGDAGFDAPGAGVDGGVVPPKPQRDRAPVPPKLHVEAKSGGGGF